MVSIQEQVQFEAQKEVRWVSISLSEVLEREMRFEASYFNVEGKTTRQLVQNCPFEKLSLNAENGFAKVTYPGRFKRVFIEDGIPIFTSSQILELMPQAKKYVSSKTTTDFEPLYLREGQIVMTRSGSVGFCSYVGKTLSGLLFSDDLLRIECYNQLDAGYVYAFLKSKIGQILVSTNNYGSVVTHLEPEHLVTLAIPNPPEKVKRSISEKIYKAFTLRDEANELLVKADSLLSLALSTVPLKELKPKCYRPSDVLNFEVKISDLNLRFEAVYHAPIINEINAQIAKNRVELTTIGDKRVSKKIILPGRFKRIYVDREFGVPFLGGKDITQFDPPELDYLSLKGHGPRIAKELTLCQNMLLITCSGTIGNVLLVPKHLEGWTASQHIIRIVSADDFNVGYLYAFLASEYGYQLIKQNIYGSVVDEINDDQIASIRVPLLKQETMNEIGNLVLKANDLRSEAWFLEKQAVQNVEDLIKNNQKG
ncbi:restriction endonuclease subunit S [Candidatus Micrarchaeota archaeon]|nr:restriction endonuclease subunit S [Candidatus Micrarchaeota archaeon]MBU1166486.1 restriction endonuclease subunit S [Candidatus Micrarchaeota archaeon]MBU1887144.1 restriction endonuclease subunit S [Candidatus Micrarchaeota archaeon]